MVSRVADQSNHLELDESLCPGGVVGGWGDFDESVEDCVEWNCVGGEHDGFRPSHGGALRLGGTVVDYCSVINFSCLQFYLGGLTRTADPLRRPG